MSYFSEQRYGSPPQTYMYDVGIYLHFVDQRCHWPVDDAVRRRVNPCSAACFQITSGNLVESCQPIHKPPTLSHYFPLPQTLLSVCPSVCPSQAPSPITTVHFRAMDTTYNGEPGCWKSNSLFSAYCRGQKNGSKAVADDASEAFARWQHRQTAIRGGVSFRAF